MAPRRDGDGTRRYRHDLTDEDRDWIRRRVAELRTSRAAIARKAGMSRQNFYQLLDGKQSSTNDWHAIVAALGGTPPSGMPPITDARLATVVRRWPELSEEDKQIVELIAKRSRKS